MATCTSTISSAAQRSTPPTPRLSASIMSARRVMAWPARAASAVASIAHDRRAGVHLPVVGIGHVAADAVAVGDEALRDAPDQFVVVLAELGDHLLRRHAHRRDHAVGELQ